MMLKTLALRAALVFALLLPAATLANQSPTCVPLGALPGSDLLDFLDDAFAAIQSSNSGTEEPANDCSEAPVQGQPWLDLTDGTLSYFDGGEWLPIGVLDAGTHIWKPVVGGGATSIDSATTTDLWSVPDSYVVINGATTITSFGGVTTAPGAKKDVLFTGALTLTYNATSLITPTLASIQTAAGDRAQVIALGGGNAAVVSFTRANGKALSNPVAVGDTGSGGQAGLVPAAGAGDAALNKLYGAGGDYVPGVPVGTLLDYSGISAPGGFLFANGAAVSRSTYADLWTVLHSQATVTVTIASPAVVTWTGHSLTPGAPVACSTTGALPTGISSATTYYVIAAGIASNSFELSATPGGAAINTSGTQSGVHTCVYAPYGFGNYTTTFNLPDARGRVVAGRDDMGGASANRLTATTTQGVDGDVLGKTGGEEAHTLTINELAAHTHGFRVGDNGSSAGPHRGSGGFQGNESVLQTQSTGGDAAHNVLQPTLISNKIIRY